MTSRSRRLKSLSDVTVPMEFWPGEPWPTPDRRFRIAKHFAAAGCAVPECVNDEWIDWTWSRLRSSDGVKPPCVSDADYVLRCAMSDSGAAYSSSPVGLVDELDARILAGQTNETIASRMPLTAAQVEAYERLLFAVRHMLATPSFIQHFAIGGNVRTPLGSLWREYGYFHGQFTLEWMVGVFRQLPANLQQVGLRAYLSPLANCPAILKLLVRARTTKVTYKNLARFTRYLQRELARIENFESPGGLLDFAHIDQGPAVSAPGDETAVGEQPRQRKRRPVRAKYRKAG